MRMARPVPALFPGKRRRFFGANIDLLTMDESLKAVDPIIAKRVPIQHVGVNVSKLILMKEDKALADMVNACPIINVDGQGVVWGAQWLGIPVPERVTGIDLFERLIARAAQKGYRVYFFGAREEMAKRTVENFLRDYPELQVAGWRNGYFKDEEEAQIVQDIRRSGADMLFVAMTSPKKEYFLTKYLEEMNVPFAMGVGGSFDVIAGMTLRAPLWAQRSGFEWLFRLLNEPRRLWKRYLSTNLVFAWMLLKAMVFGKKKYECD